MTGLVVVALSLGFMLFRVVSPTGTAVKGKDLRTFTLTYRERLAMQQLNLCALAVLLLLSAVGHWFKLPIELVVIVAAYGILLVPASYVLTDAGIGLNRVVFRQWSEFAALDVSPTRITLKGQPGNGFFRIWIRGSHQQEILPLLRRHLPESGRLSEPTSHPKPSKPGDGK